MKKGLLLFFIILVTVSVGSTVYANGLYMNGLGSRAMSMGGAFVGLADDFSAGFWNPAAVAQLDWTTFGIYFAYFMPTSSYVSETGDVSTEFAKNYPGGLGSVFVPVSERINLGFSIYTLSRYQAEWSGAEIGSIVGDQESRDWIMKVWTITFAPSITYKLSDTFSLALAFNFNFGYYDNFMYKGIISYDTAFGTDYLDVGAYSDSGKGVGFGGTLSFFYKPSEVFSFGVSIRSPSKMRFLGRSSSSDFYILDNATESKTYLTYPLWVAGGFAIKPNQSFTLTADVQFSQWSSVESIRTEYESSLWQFIFEKSGEDAVLMYWEDTIQIRFGAEYRLNKIALRAGFYTDPSPVPDKTMNFHFPIVDANFITFGFEYDGRGLSLHGFQIDFGFEYGMGKERTISSSEIDTNTEYANAIPGTYKMDMLGFNFSFRYSF
jgi:long-chain fatty acid transport protein